MKCINFDFKIEEETLEKMEYSKIERDHSITKKYC